MSYTQLSLTAVVLVVFLDLFVVRTRLLTRRGFWTAYTIVISFQLLTNAWLTNDIRTGTPIVSYDEKTITGIRIAYAPIEDLFFGFAMILLTLVLWVFWGRRSSTSSSKPSRSSHA